MTRKELTQEMRAISEMMGKTKNCTKTEWERTNKKQYAEYKATICERNMTVNTAEPLPYPRNKASRERRLQPPLYRNRKKYIITRRAALCTGRAPTK